MKTHEEKLTSAYGQQDFIWLIKQGAELEQFCSTLEHELNIPLKN